MGDRANCNRFWCCRGYPGRNSRVRRNVFHQRLPNSVFMFGLFVLHLCETQIQQWAFPYHRWFATRREDDCYKHLMMSEKHEVMLSTVTHFSLILLNFLEVTETKRCFGARVESMQPTKFVGLTGDFQLSCRPKPAPFIASPSKYWSRELCLFFSIYSCFDKGCHTEVWKLTRQCRLVLWVVSVRLFLIEV